MSEVTNSRLNQQVYNAGGGDITPNQVAKVICALLPRGILIGGFGEKGDLLTVRYNDYKKDLNTWILDFYEFQFINEPLLAKPERVVAVFVGGDKNIIIPGALYENAAAETWLKKIHYVESIELIAGYNLPEDSAKYVYAWPSTIKSLIIRYFTNARVFPLAAYQFHKTQQQGYNIHCCVTTDQVYATLYRDGELQWHQVFNYETGEDIAYHIKLLCKQSRIDAKDVKVYCTLFGKVPAYAVDQLSQYITLEREKNDLINTSEKNWIGSISLLQRLYQCAL